MGTEVMQTYHMAIMRTIYPRRHWSRYRIQSIRRSRQRWALRLVHLPCFVWMIMGGD